MQSDSPAPPVHSGRPAIDVDAIAGLADMAAEKLRSSGVES